VRGTRLGESLTDLLAHGTLIRVARRLIVMRERDETGAHAQDGEGLDLEVGRVVTNE
jgi:hypothetical protein